jgi:transposase-like protein
MIIEKHKCTRCKSENIRKNGTDKFNGKQKYHCLDCNSYGTLNAGPKYSFARKKEILDAYFERPSMRGIARIFKVSRQTLATWLIELGKKEEFKDLNASLNDVPHNDTLELDELCSFVQKKRIKNGCGQQ